MAKQNKPAIRFKGFTDAWEQRKVSDLAEKTYGGGTPTTSNEAYWNGDIPWIQSSDVVDGKLLGVEPRKRITQNGLNNSAAQLIPENSIAIITRVGVGKLAFMPYSYATSQDFLSLSKLNAEPLFTVYACYKKLQSELNAVQGTSIKGITKDELLTRSIMVPQYAEQQQIGSFFQQLDHLITLHQRKYDKLQVLKKAMLEKMFPKNGSSVPEIRFKGFTDAWEQRKLGEVVERITRKNENLESTLPLTISAQYGLINQNEFFDKRIASKDVSGYFLVRNGEFAYNKSTSSDAPWGAIKRLDRYESGVLSTLYIVFKILDERKTSSDYIVTYYNTDLWHKGIQAIAAEGARNHGLLNVAPADFFETNLTMPKNYAEQQQIGSFFQQLDHLITLHQRELEKLQNIKKSMLEKMFV
jgi:type I restriction enzyme S subunit